MTERGLQDEPSRSSDVDGLPFVGRADLLASVSEAMDNLEDRRGVDGFVIGGLHQSGRTSVLERIHRHAGERGWLTLHVATTFPADDLDEEPETPGGAGSSELLWRQVSVLAAELQARRPGSLAVRALHEALSDPPLPLVAACRLAAKLTAEAAEECRTQVLLTVDDIDRWAPHSAATLRHLNAPAARSLPLLSVVTTLPGLGADDDPASYGLGPLSVAELTSAPELGLDEATARRLIEASGGWPAVMASLLDDEVLDWPVRGADYFEQITAALTPTERRYVETVCSLGEGPTDIGRLAKALGDSTRFSAESSKLAGVRATLIEAGLLYSPSADQVDIALAGYRNHLSSAPARH